MEKHEIDHLVKNYLEHDNRHSSNLKHYVIKFFLNEKEILNISKWEFHHNDFVRWLDQVGQLKDKNKTLSLGTKRNCLAALNSFYKWLSLQGIIESKRI